MATDSKPKPTPDDPPVSDAGENGDGGGGGHAIDARPDYRSDFAKKAGTRAVWTFAVFLVL